MLLDFKQLTLTNIFWNADAQELWPVQGDCVGFYIMSYWGVDNKFFVIHEGFSCIKILNQSKMDLKL